MVQPIRSLGDLERHGGSIHAECRQCGRVAIFGVGDLIGNFRRRKLNMAWPIFAQKLRCKPPTGCGSYNPEVSWVPSEPPPEDDPPAPRPRFVRSGAPLGVDEGEWARARGDRERRRLMSAADSAGEGIGSMMTIEETVRRVGSLANVVSVIMGASVGEHQASALVVIAREPVPHETIERLTSGIAHVEIIPVLEAPVDAADRFRSEPYMERDVLKRGGGGREGEAKMLAARLGLSAPPTLNVIMDGKLGILFASVDDALKFDAAKRGGNGAQSV